MKSGNTILLADIDGPSRQLYRLHLENEGYEVLLTDTGHEAGKMLMQSAPDVIVMEWGLRDWAAEEVLHKAIKQPRRIPVIINTRHGTIRQDYAAGLADRFFVKSNNVAPLLQAVRELVPRGMRAVAPVISNPTGNRGFRSAYLPSTKRHDTALDISSVLT